MALRAGVLLPRPSLLLLPRIRCSAGGRPDLPAREFAALAAVFRRRLLAGISSASLVALGANFGGLTSFLLGLSPELGRSLRLDVLYPVEGFTRCLDSTHGFEFIYPETWVGDQTLLYRAIGRAESERSLDPPPLTNGRPPVRPVSEPVAAFGPPGSNGELNVSVIVSTVPGDFAIEDFGGPREVGETVLRRIAGSRKGTDVNAALVDASVRADASKKVNYYKLEFRVEAASFRRRNVAVCCARGGKLFTLNAQAPEAEWPEVEREFHAIADSFNLTDA
ncbi:psbP domain-containing protein 7, chloroplastic-like [Curcuma longa]|uniref:psbP domain-containing protein 7, chloroplastic-like n=1 Tax=Curcuma longa TaxID=136217 RepID=UPI003D9DD07D